MLTCTENDRHFGDSYQPITRCRGYRKKGEVQSRSSIAVGCGIANPGSEITILGDSGTLPSRFYR
jgi:hypothetical protein